MPIWKITIREVNEVTIISVTSCTRGSPAA